MRKKQNMIINADSKLAKDISVFYKDYLIEGVLSLEIDENYVLKKIKVKTLWEILYSDFTSKWSGLVGSWKFLIYSIKEVFK